MQKHLNCPGYQQPLRWSTKHERPSNATTNTPGNFTHLATSASKAISKAEESSRAPPSAMTSDYGGSTRQASSSLSPRPHPDACPGGAGALPGHTKRDDGPGAETSTWGTFDVSIPQPVVNIQSFLIEHWFKSVCGWWSALDSLDNPYRRLTSELCFTSEPVFYALQAISAASLFERLPAVLCDTARVVSSKATNAINEELLRFSTRSYKTFPSELLLALFCMSSSTAWLESRELGLAYLRQARQVLKTLEVWQLGEKESRLFEFFQGCLIYEEMLRSVVSQDKTDLKNMLGWSELPQTALATTKEPHPWTGVSPDMFRLFGKAVALCIRSRMHRWHNHGISYKMLQESMKDIEEAMAVEEALIARILEGTDPVQRPVPNCDLDNITEAYRLASLLQLYESFPDLTTKRMGDCPDVDDESIWNTSVTPLALEIIKILQLVPVSSMRRIQPLLCLCAGSGLRIKWKAPVAARDPNFLDSLEPMPPPHVNSTATASSVGIFQARCVLMDRLEQLKSHLPRKPIDVATQLIQAVWDTYDKDILTMRRTHWLDVMSNTGLYSIFG